MRLDNERAYGWHQVAPRLWWVLPVACSSSLHACTADVDVFRSHEGREAAVAAATASGATTDTPSAANTAGTQSNPSVLIEPGAAPKNEDGRCQPGHYVGTFNGTYNSAAWGNGTSPLTISATPAMGRPGLEFWLESSPRNCRSDDEFCPDFTLRGGKIRGFANPFSTGAEAPGADNVDPLTLAVRFEIDFGGDLDCSSGMFRGLLENGCYDVATVLFRFRGTAPAEYDPKSTSFTLGQWTVKELSTDGWPAEGDLGGTGRWQATLANDTMGPAGTSAGLCGVPAPTP